MIEILWNIVEKLILILQILFCLIALKSMIIGSEFSFYFWFKYKKKYIKWYTKRKTFEEFIKN
jgi:hypothetical protein